MHSTPFLNFQNVPIALGRRRHRVRSGHWRLARRNENGHIGISVFARSSLTAPSIVGSVPDKWKSEPADS